MKRLVAVRWLLLPAATVSGALCVFSRLTPGRALFTVVCAWGWYAMSSRLVYSVDRETLGIPLRDRSVG